jgi:hypothetical protein
MQFGKYIINMNPAHSSYPLVELAESENGVISCCSVADDRSILHSPLTRRIIDLKHWEAQIPHPYRLADYSLWRMGELSRVFNLPKEELDMIWKAETVIRNSLIISKHESSLERVF